MFWFVEHHSSSAVIPICGINIVLHTKIYENHKRIYIYMDKFYQLNSISLSISLSPASHVVPGHATKFSKTQ